MDFKPIELEDRAVVEAHTRGQILGDVCFSNLFMWRHARAISYARCDEWLIIQTRYEGQAPFVFYPQSEGEGVSYENDEGEANPLRVMGAFDTESSALEARLQRLLDSAPQQSLESKSAPKALIEELMAHFSAQGFALEFHSLLPHQVCALERDFPARFAFTPRRDRFDYIYRVQELSELAGRKFHKKKNHINKFYLQYPQTRYERIDSHNAGELLAVANRWYEAQASAQEASGAPKDMGLYFENLGIGDALRHFTELHLRGGLLRVDSEIIAFSFGEEVGARSALIHIEKANIAFSGAYQAINQALLKNEFSHLLYANREEDLGIEGLRKAKLSYQPAFLLEKYDARLL